MAGVLEHLECSVQRAVGMQAHRASVHGGDSARARVGIDVDERAVRLLFVRFHLAAPHSDVILKLPPSRIECIAYRDTDILVGVMLRRIPTDDDVLAGQMQVDGDVKQLALLLMLVRRPDRHAAADDDVRVPLQFARQLVYGGLDGVRLRRVVKIDFDGYLHRRTR